MEHILKILAHHWALTSAQYWHLRLLVATSLGPLLGILYLILFGRRKQSRPNTVADSEPSLWVSSQGRLYSSR
jgi:hypothetical protein